MISFPAPVLSQYSDENLVLVIGEIIFPGCFRRWPGENGLRIWVEGDRADSASRIQAVARFQTALGVLRTWRPEAGELADESRAGVGVGSVRDEQGNQYITLGMAIEYMDTSSVAPLATRARRGIVRSENLRNALWLSGRPNRNAADYYMIHEYAESEFGGPRGIRDALGMSLGALTRLSKSANNLSPLAGGRHADVDDSLVIMSLEEQRTHTAALLRSWIGTYSGRRELSGSNARPTQARSPEPI